MSKLTSEVQTGLGTVLGLIATIAAGTTMVVQSAQNNEALLTGTNKPAGIIAFVSLIATVLGRMFQAANLPKAAAIAGDVEKLPDALAALAAEAQKNVAIAQANPDGVDSAAVPFATATPAAPPAATP